MDAPDHEFERSPGIDFGDLRHDLMNPLATIRGRAQLLTRAIERSTTIDESERARLLRGLAAIELAVLTAVDVLDGAEQAAAPADDRRPNAR